MQVFKLPLMPDTEAFLIPLRILVAHVEEVAIGGAAGAAHSSYVRPNDFVAPPGFDLPSSSSLPNIQQVGVVIILLLAPFLHFHVIALKGDKISWPIIGLLTKNLLDVEAQAYRIPPLASVPRRRTQCALD